MVGGSIRSRNVAISSRSSWAAGPGLVPHTTPRPAVAPLLLLRTTGRREHKPRAPGSRERRMWIELVSSVRTVRTVR